MSITFKCQNSECDAVCFIDQDKCDKCGHSITREEIDDHYRNIKVKKGILSAYILIGFLVFAGLNFIVSDLKSKSAVERLREMLDKDLGGAQKKKKNGITIIICIYLYQCVVLQT